MERGHPKRPPRLIIGMWPKAQPEIAPEMERHSAALKNAPNARAENDRFPWAGCGKVMFAIARWSWDVQGRDSVRLSNQPVTFVLDKTQLLKLKTASQRIFFESYPV